jgi:acetyl esterase
MPENGFTRSAVRTTVLISNKTYLHVSIATYKFARVRAMPLDARLKPFLADPRNHVRPPPAHVPMEKVRRAANAAMPGPARVEIAEVRTLAGPGGIALRLYRPTDAPGLPIILFLHGGGWVWGDLDTHDTICRALAQKSGAAVASIEYRLAPETRFPGQLEDGLAVLRWLRAEAGTLALDGARIALCGDSAGGNIACAMAMVAGKYAMDLRHLAMIYPVLDAACASRSQREFADGYLLSGAGMKWFWDCYLGESAHAGNPLASPLAASPAELSALPPVSIATAEFDILRDEGETFAAHLRQVGIAVSLRRHDGMVHGFLSLPSVEDVALAAIADIAGDIAASLED